MVFSHPQEMQEEIKSQEQRNLRADNRAEVTIRPPTRFASLEIPRARTENPEMVYGDHARYMVASWFGDEYRNPLESCDFMVIG